MNSPKIPFIARLALTLISIICLGYLLILGQGILAPFFFAFLLALLFEPFAKFLETKLSFPRVISTLTTLIVVLLIIGGTGYFIANQLSSFGADVPQLQQQFSDVFKELQTWVAHSFHMNTEKQFDYINQALDKVLSSSGTILGFTFGMVSSIFGFLFFCFIFFLFILNYRRILYRFIVHVFPERHAKRVKLVVGEVQNMTKSYLTGVAIQIVSVSLLSSGLLMLFHVKYAILLGVITGLLNVIPYVGIGISLCLSVLMAFATSVHPVTALYVGLGYLGIHAIDGNFILPFVVGSKVKINALFSFLGILVGAEMWGISGMFLCIPALAILKIVFERIEEIEPWGVLLGEGRSEHRKKRHIKISKKIHLREKE